MDCVHRLIRTVAMLGTLVVMTGCGSLQFIDKTGHAHPGTFDSVSKKLEATINGKKYEGIYVTNAGSAFSSGWSYGAKPAFVSGQTVISGNSGRAILRADGGDSIQCEFSYQGMTAIGNCEGANGERYQLVTQ